ncbi:MAG: ATP-binding cassette domain-containing protein [Eubacteriales bacterium]|nr:ATP-binding cassette domain-containing protein [Eubacteriales bacterium]
MADWLIKTEHLCKKYPESTPLKDVNIEVRKGDIISIIGPSGTGKTTLIRCLNGLTQPSGGKVWFHDQEVTSIIKDLSEEGMTILIVTHEMKFARNISNRVFYMDEGGVYEEGTPEEIFDAPKREKTRKFIKQLQTTEIIINEPNYNFAECVDKIYEFAAKRRFRHRRIMCLNILFEELVAIGLIESREEFSPVRFVIEYSEKDDTLAMDVFYGGENYDPLKNVPAETEKLILHESSVYHHEYGSENHIFIKMKEMI